MKKKVFILSVVALTIMSMVLVGCKGSSELTIPVGLNAELTGDIPSVGASCKNAALLAVKEVNDAGGLDIGGKKYIIKLFIEDNGGKADQAAAVTQKLITQDNVVAVIGPNASRYAIPAAAVAESSKVLMISPWSTNPKLTIDPNTGKPAKYVFRACFTDSFQGQVVAKFAMEKLGAKKAAVLYDVASEYNKGIAEVFKNTFEKLGGQVVAFETYTTGDKDFSAQLTKIKQANPDVIFLPNYYNEVPLQIQQAHRLGITATFIGSDSWGSEDLIKLGGKDVDGYFFSTHYARDIPAPATQKFISAYTAAYGSVPDDVAALTYDSFGLLFEALKTANKIDRQAVRDALATLSHYEGVTGTLQFKEGSGDPIKSAVILQIKDGKFVYYATANP
jgi:branched-chain amino acid transport system substrate-binding protein